MAPWIEAVTPEQARPGAGSAEAAAAAMLEAARAEGGALTILALGALTNVAVAARDADFTLKHF